ncbi:endonuclease/exonuclease/phosphatase family protein [Paraflavisolibacter sp. H34]|uniref:endonuclease/exonuclease/phosphatase family protein n=1 Tax=Huijunlia imazamoxiresistens TaxID=3127457 RepID=UPI003016ECA4
MLGALTAWILSLAFILVTLLPLVRNDYWTFRILEYPRFQKLVLGGICLALLYLLRPQVEGAFPYLFGVCAACCVYQIVKIFPYTTLAPKEMLRARELRPEAALKIFTANVLQSNRKFDNLLQQIGQTGPDLVFLVETDPLWAENLQVLDKDYPFSIKLPLDNTYGLLFYSRLPLRHSRVLFRTDPEVPSIETEVQLPAGPWVKVFGLHPKPPVPGEALYSTAKDKELMKVAFAVEHEQEPCVVMGDLNDVAWSHVTRLFRKVSGLLDPRRGRGFYSTFSANNPLMRFPLDYIFCSSHFGLVRMQRLPHNGSDHFAMFIHLQYHPVFERVQDTPEASAEEKAEAADKATDTVPADS